GGFCETSLYDYQNSALLSAENVALHLPLEAGPRHKRRLEAVRCKALLGGSVLNDSFSCSVGADDIESKLHHQPVTVAPTLGLCGVIQQDMFLLSWVVESVSDSNPVHAEVRGHGKGGRCFQVYCGAARPIPMLDVIRTFGEECRCCVHASLMELHTFQSFAR